MTTPFQQSPYLRVQRDFPGNDIKMLAVQSDKAYIDVAQAVNSRIIGTHAIGQLIVIGEKWYFTGSNTGQQALRKIFNFSSTGSFSHGINFSSVFMVSPKSCGTFTDGSGNFYGVVYGSNVAIAGNLSFYVTMTDIVILAGAGAPSISSGIIDIEVISTF